MAEFDLFELTGLPFDPPEKLPKKVKIAIDKKLKELGTSLGSSTQQIERDEKKSQIDFLNGIAGKIFSTTLPLKTTSPTPTKASNEP